MFRNTCTCLSILVFSSKIVRLEDQANQLIFSSIKNNGTVWRLGPYAWGMFSFQAGSKTLK